MAQLSPIVVKQAINTLRSQGKKITNRSIVDCLGYGSFSTLKKIRECHPEVFNTTDTDSVVNTVQVSSVHQTDSVLEKRVLSLEMSIQLIQKSIQQLIQDKTILALQQQIKELTESLEEMYQLWRELTEKLTVQNSKKVVTTASAKPATKSKKPICDWITNRQMEIPDPKQGKAFLAWAEQQKGLSNGWQAVVDQLNQQQVFMPKGGAWTAKSLSDFIRKKRQQFKGKRSQSK